MRLQFFLTCCLMAFQTLLNAQLNTPNTTAPSQKPAKIPNEVGVATPPAFPGGEDALLRFLAENIQYPLEARTNNIEGKVVLSFVVGTDGHISDIRIFKDIPGGCGEAAAKVVAAMPRWIPAKLEDGTRVKVRYTLPVNFRLGEEAVYKPAKTGSVHPSLPQLVDSSKLQEAPLFPGGEEAFVHFLRTQIAYPKEAWLDGEQGTSILTFTVRKNGAVANVSVYDSECEPCSEAVAKALMAMPLWTPGKDKKGNPTKARYTLSVNFRLDTTAPRPAHK